MKISILTLFPKMIEGFFSESIVKRATEKGLTEIEVIDIRKFADDNYGTVDDRPYGGGAGMVMRADVLHRALGKVKSGVSKTILASPKGRVFNQETARRYAKLDHLIIISGHYEGVDERVLDYIDEEISMGDFVSTGGEITAAAIADSVVRLIPGVLKKDEATQLESFFLVSMNQLMKTVGASEVLVKLKQKGIEKVQLLEYPQYTRPEEFQGKKVPDVLLSGNHKEIEEWRLKKAFEETLKKRPDLLK